MASDIKHTDPFLNSLKETFEDWQPDFIPEDITSDWGNIKSQIAKPTRINFSIKNIAYTTLSVAVIATGVVLYSNYKSSSNIDEPVQNEIIEVNTDIASLDPEKNINIVTEELNLKSSSQDNSIDNSPIILETNTDITNESLDAKTDLESTRLVETSENKLDAHKSSKDSKDGQDYYSYNRSLIVDDITMEFPQKIIYCSSRKPKAGEIVFSDTVICTDEPLKINNISSKPENILDIRIQNKRYNDVNSSISHKFDKPGKYDAILTFTENNNQFSKSIKIHVEANPIADFSYDISETPVIRFKNETRGGVRFEWNFGDNNTSLMHSPKHKYYDTGRFIVTLIALSKAGCSDTARKSVHVLIYPKIDFANVFTPNGDDKNERFKIIISGEKLFDLKIYDRYLNVVFETKDKNETWDGTYNNLGKLCPTGTYYYLLKYQFIGYHKQLIKKGTVDLNR